MQCLHPRDLEGVYVRENFMENPSRPPLVLFIATSTLPSKSLFSSKRSIKISFLDSSFPIQNSSALLGPRIDSNVFLT